MTQLPETFVEVKSSDLYRRGMPVINAHAAAIDVASEEHWVCVVTATGEQQVRKFGQTSDQLHEVLAWLLSHGVRTVALESTGVYWIPLYDLLEAHGLDPWLVDGRSLKRVKGRPKTDKLDCQWLQRLHACGLLTRSFLPPLKLRLLREVWRQRERCVAHGAQLVLRMQKMLVQMNVQLPTVISDIVGVSGLSMLQAIVAGERDPLTLARLAHPRIKASEAQLVAAFKGIYHPELVMLLELHLMQYEQNRRDIAKLDVYLGKALDALPKAAVWTPTDEQLRQCLRPRTNAPSFDAERLIYELSGVHLTAVPGFATNDTLGLLLEIGLSVAAWPTDKHFGSWLKLSPNACKSGGKEHGRQRTRKGKHRAAHAFRRAALSLRRSDCPLGHRLRQLAHQHGLAYAITAVARQLAMIFYHLIGRREDYREVPREAYDRLRTERRLRRLQKEAAELGLVVTATPAAMPA
jgi:transposase